jgi:CRISPR-associated protein Csd1
MLNQLVEYGKRIRTTGSDALKEEPYEITLTISESGDFASWNSHEKRTALVELIAAKKGKARLLLDKAEEVLGLDNKKHELFLEKLDEYRHLPSLKPLMLFYEGDGVKNARSAFAEEIPVRHRNGNIAFIVYEEGIFLHEHEEVIREIEKKYAEKQINLSKRRCSVCGSDLYPVTDEPHGMIKGVPKGQSSGSAFISFNMPAFESYGLAGNLNASVCTACARNYVIALNTLLNDGENRLDDKGKKRLHYYNRKNLSRDTAMVFWTRSGNKVEEINYPDETKENFTKIKSLSDKSTIARLLEGSRRRRKKLSNEGDLGAALSSPAKGKKNLVIDKDRFYSFALSGTAARIAVRDFIETATETAIDNIADWFYNIKIVKTNFDTHTQETVYPSVYELSNSCAVHIKEGDRYKCDFDDPAIGNTAVILWKAALTGISLPDSLLDRVLRRIRLERGRVITARASLIKLILNKGGYKMSYALEETNKELAYTAGRIFALLDSIQAAALGKNINAPLSERFYAAASTYPSQTFGRLMRLNNNHFSKLKKEKPRLAVTLDKKLAALFVNLDSVGFPMIFSLKEQGLFAIGYYHQRQDNFTKGESNE